MFKCCIIHLHDISKPFILLCGFSLGKHAKQYPRIQESIQVLETRDLLHKKTQKGNVLFGLAVLNVKISSPFNHSHVQLCVIPEAHFDIAWGKWYSRWQEWIKWFHCCFDWSCLIDTLKYLKSQRKPLELETFIQGPATNAISKAIQHSQKQIDMMTCLHTSDASNSTVPEITRAWKANTPVTAWGWELTSFIGFWIVPDRKH